MDSQTEKQFAHAFAMAMHSFHHLAGRIIKSGSIPLAQYRLLMLLQERGPVTIKELSRFLAIAQSSASELAARALDSKLVERANDPQDGRRALYSLSPTARKLLKNRRREMKKIYLAVLDPLSPADQQRLVEAFESIAVLLQVRETK
jgi:MarR family transcriptional regulator, organic hydroperoxide resistance regulator